MKERIHRRSARFPGWEILLVLLLHPSLLAALPEFDFTRPAEAAAWGQAHDAELRATAAGLEIRITGSDPYFSGPPRNYPADENLWMLVRLKSAASGMAQLFYFEHGASEERSVRFHAPAGEAELRVALPPLGPRTRLRIDPPGSSGVCLLKSIRFEVRPQLREPEWPAPPQVRLAGPISITSDDVELRHDGQRLGAFELHVAGRKVAMGHSRPLLGYSNGSQPAWLAVTNQAVVSRVGEAIRARTTARDAQGGDWKFEMIFRPSPSAGGIEIESSVTVSENRDATFLPMFLLFTGVGTTGTNKSQGLFAGLEYLENEPSSSKADVIGPGAWRKTPDSLKVTFPLMAVAADERYVGLIWESSPKFAALFDSPDRVFHSGGHLMGVIFPGAAPEIREDGQVLPYGGVKLAAGEVLRLKATIVGGQGTTVVPAIQQYVRREGLPGLPKFSKEEYFRLAAHGWLDSEIRDGARYRHAVGANFGSGPAGDAALLMQWLAQKIEGEELPRRLRTAADEARALVAPHLYNSHAVGHIRAPVQALVFGEIPANLKTASGEGRNILRHFEPDGSVILRAPKEGNDLARTHYSREANGLAATQVAGLLERASFAGDAALMKEALRLLRALDEFRGGVPRGAQTWEVPLHTPDILASAYLVRAYTRGYELTGEARFLEAARYWAWTGVPFIYLAAPNEQPVGVYSTIAVFGATQWVAPLWIGLPVQWCGLVYGHAIRRLARHDPDGPWLKLADGIALAGVQHTHPLADKGYAGLLPDSFELRHQVRNPVPINPATLQVEAIEAFGGPSLYDFHAFRGRGILVHAAGRIENPREMPGSIRFEVKPWPRDGSTVLVTGLSGEPLLRVNGENISAKRSESGQILVPLRKSSLIELDFR